MMWWQASRLQYFFKQPRRLPPQRLNQFADRLQIRVFFRDVAKRWIHFETGKQMNLRRLLISQKRVVTAHIVVINRLSQQRDGPFHEQLFCLKRLAELVQTKSGVEKPG